MTIFHIECPECGAHFPIASDELSGDCPDCGTVVTNPKFEEED